MTECVTSKVHRGWKIAAVSFVLFMLAIIISVPRLHVRADRRACLARIQAFATAMQLRESQSAQQGMGLVPSSDADTEKDRLAARYFCPTTKKPFVFVGHSGSDSSGDENRIIAYEPLTDRHGTGGCVVYADGRAAFLAAPRYQVATKSSIDLREHP